VALVVDSGVVMSAFDPFRTLPIVCCKPVTMERVQTAALPTSINVMCLFELRRISHDVQLRRFLYHSLTIYLNVNFLFYTKCLGSESSPGGGLKAPRLFRG
jgi:hypothetical protein